jgi:dipeptidyl aminopeptidase/acylaminoacyl peptidase
MRLRSLITVVVLGLPLLAFAQRRPITDKDLFEFVWIGDMQMSPTGSKVAFVQTTVAADHSGYETSLYVLDTANAGATPVRLTMGTHDSSPRWSPDGTHLAFLRAVEKEGKAAPPQLYMMAAEPRSSAIRLTELPKGASGPQWSPDGTVLTVLSGTPQDTAKAKLDAAKKSRATGDEAHVSDVRIVNREVYRLNGEGNLDPTFVPQLYMVSMPKADGSQDAPWQLTGGLYAVEEYVWRPGSSWILYTSEHVDEPYYDTVPHNTLFGFEVKPGGAHQPGIVPTQFTVEMPFEIRGLAPSQDGEHLAFHAQAFPIAPAPAVSHQESDLFVVDLAEKKGTLSASAPRDLTGGKGFEMGGGVGGDNTAPRGAGRPAIVWSGDGKQLLDVAGSQGSALLLGVGVSDGSINKLSARKQAVLNFVASKDAKSVIALISNPIMIGDMFRIEPAVAPGGPTAGTPAATAGNQTQLTHVNDALFAKLDLQMPENLHVTPTVKAEDIPYVSIDTFVQLPPQFDKTKKYPAILNIHGGPHASYGWVFDHEMLWMAAKGYVTIYPNPRGSTTYGQRFANVIENNYPGDDFHDLMDAVDAVVAKGWADPDKLGVTGGSGGGLLTDWTVTQTNRFKAGVAQRDIVDAAAWWYTADIGEFRQYWWPEAPFASQAHLDVYKAHSPLTFINNVKTPMMFILGDADYRTPPTAGGEIFFRALKYMKIPTVMVRFPRESHELSRSGEPWHRIERLDNILGWFDKYLMGRCEPQFEVKPTCTAAQ